jgi:hypothetical protein
MYMYIHIIPRVILHSLFQGKAKVTDAWLCKAGPMGTELRDCKRVPELWVKPVGE